MKPDLRTMKWELTFHASIDAPRGPIDNWIIHDPIGSPEHMIAFTVPKGRDDIADFVLRSLRAGQNVLSQLPAGQRFKPDKAMPFIGRRPH